jgi:rRNA maturation endonuclease Nob1
MFELPAATAAYCIILAAVFVGLWLYYDRRDHARFEIERRKTTFACIRCDKLYAGPAGADLQKCPRCGHENVRLSF